VWESERPLDARHVIDAIPGRWAEVGQSTPWTPTFSSQRSFLSLHHDHGRQRCGLASRPRLAAKQNLARLFPNSDQLRVSNLDGRRADRVLPKEPNSSASVQRSIVTTTEL
jgi:hypothetical protein